MLGTVERKKQREDEGQYKMDDRIGKVFFLFLFGGRMGGLKVGVMKGRVGWEERGGGGGVGRGEGGREGGGKGGGGRGGGKETGQKKVGRRRS